LAGASEGAAGARFPVAWRRGRRLTQALRTRASLPPQTMPSISSDRAALCAGCGGKISDRYYLLAVDKQWHMRCLKCCECKLNLESELTCFSKDGSIYCKEDYYSPSLDGPYRRFSVQRCARCHLGISASEMVMRARDLVYHLNCFTCTTCNKMLTTGDHFGMKDSLVYCRLHFEALLQGEYTAHFNHADVAAAAAAAAAAKSAGLGAAGANPLGLPYYNGVGTVQKGRPRKRKSPGPGADLAAYNAALSCNENDAEHLDRDQPYPSSQKTKRMRTSFKHHQLRTMKSYFAINHNPDAKDLKQLAQKTGLTKRVLQVSRAGARGGGICGVRTWGGIPQWPWALEGPSTLRPPISLSFSVLFLHLFSLSLAVFQYFFSILTLSSLLQTLPEARCPYDLTSPTLPTVTSVLTSVPGNLEGHEPHSPSQTTLTNLF
ncbi:hypothetical protein E2I00_000391, partial [Balaenoptera physalus]